MSAVLIGHNGGPTFDDIVADNKGNLLLNMKETIMAAVRDPRLDRRHLRVLAEVIDHINSVSCTAYPGHKAIAAALRRYNVDGYPDQGYSDQGIRNTLSDLVSFGYLVSVRRAPEGGGRPLAHYTIRRPPVAELQDFITTWIMERRCSTSRPHPIAKARQSGADVSKGFDVIRQGDVIRDGDVISLDDIISQDDISPTGSVSHRVAATKTPPDVRSGGDVISPSDVTSDVISPVPTVTKEKELLLDSESSPLCAPSAAAEVPPDEPTCVEAEAGFGVLVNGRSIRHASGAFRIDLPAVHMAAKRAKLSDDDINAICLTRARGWGERITQGVPAEAVVPGDVVGSLSAEIVQEAERAREAEKAARAAAKGARLPLDWRLPRSWGEWALNRFEVAPDRIRREAETFRDYWHGATRNATKRDWFAAWRVWCSSDKLGWPERKGYRAANGLDLASVDEAEGEAYHAQWEAARLLGGGLDVD